MKKPSKISSLLGDALSRHKFGRQVEAAQVVGYLQEKVDEQLIGSSWQIEVTSYKNNYLTVTVPHNGMKIVAKSIAEQVVADADLPLKINKIIVKTGSFRIDNMIQ